MISDEEGKKKFTEGRGFKRLMRLLWLKMKYKNILDGVMSKQMVECIGKGRHGLGNMNKKRKVQGFFVVFFF